MRNCLIYSPDELDVLARQAIAGDGGSPTTFCSWQLEVSNDNLPRLHVTYYAFTPDGRKLRLIIVPLKGPTK